MPLSDIALIDTERSYTVCMVGVMYASKRICGRAGFSSLRTVFLFRYAVYISLLLSLDIHAVAML